MTPFSLQSLVKLRSGLRACPRLEEHVTGPGFDTWSSAAATVAIKQGMVGCL